jgi:hypothetical protein
VSEQAHAALTFAADQQREASVKAIQSDRAFSAFRRMTQQAGRAQQLISVAYQTLEWVDWFNHQRLLEPIGNIPPAEAETNDDPALENIKMAAQDSSNPPSGKPRWGIRGALSGTRLAAPSMMDEGVSGSMDPLPSRRSSHEVPCRTGHLVGRDCDLCRR